MKERFTTEKMNKVWFIKDNDAQQYHMPNMVGIYFKNQYRPQEICNILNAEWQEFLANPS